MAREKLVGSAFSNVHRLYNINFMGNVMTNSLDVAANMLNVSPYYANVLKAWSYFQTRVPTNPATLAEIERQNQEAKESVL